MLAASQSGSWNIPDTCYRVTIGSQMMVTRVFIFVFP
jgi:hypothetical protein